MELPIEFVQNKPLNSRFDMTTLKEVMTQDEIREELGLKALEIDEETQEEESEEVQMSKQSQLDSFLSSHGETMEGYDILNEDDSLEEGEDFDFESELNNNHIELASVGGAYPNRKSEQDGTSKQKDNNNIYRVRYKYVGNPSPERPFCQKMLSSNKVFRKEDIIKMSSMKVNEGWGLNGADTYSIWKFKGGGACKHSWRRYILVQEGKRPKNSDLVITTTAARSQGFKTPVNEQEVPVAPTDMVNKGFVNK
jgi:hypothetical protein